MRRSRGVFRTYRTSMMERWCKKSKAALIISVTQLTFTCSRSTTETLEKSVNMFKLTIKHQKDGVFVVDFEHNLHLFLVFLLLTLNK